jgi:hypothetical protein
LGPNHRESHVALSSLTDIDRAQLPRCEIGVH